MYFRLANIPKPTIYIYYCKSDLKKIFINYICTAHTIELKISDQIDIVLDNVQNQKK